MKTLLTNKNLSSNLRLKRNNFTLLRFLFAGTVVLVHTRKLSGVYAFDSFTSLLSGAVAVRGFFVLSGILIFMSYENSKTYRSYFSKRIRRIYPAYFIIVMLCAIFLPVMSETFSFRYYFSLAWLKYVFFNLIFLNFLEPGLPGVFDGNKLDAINGALWTLKIEMMFYFSVPIIVYLCRRYGRFIVMVSLYLFSIAFVWLMIQMAERTGAKIYLFLGRQLPGQLRFFIAGAFIYYYLPLIERRIVLFAAAAIIIFAVNRYYPLLMLVTVHGYFDGTEQRTQCQKYPLST